MADAEIEEVVTTRDVVAWLKDRIRRGLMVPGQRLVEVDLMRDTRASRARVREALRHLSAEGLVIIEEFHGASVKRLNRAEVGRIYELREVMEGLAVRLATQRREDGFLERLSTLQAELDAAERLRNADRYARANDNWHLEIIGSSGNDLLGSFLERLRIPIVRLQFQTFYAEDLIVQANADHRAIATAIHAGRAAEAEAEMRRHIRDGLAAIEAMGEELFA